MAHHLPKDHLILKRRADEEYRHKYQDHVLEQQKTAAVTQWYNTTHQALQNRRLNETYDTIRNRDKQALEERRAKLKQLLAADAARHEAALVALDQTPDQRRQAIKERAMELKQKRELERQAYVKEAYDRQWRLACDPLRERDSKLVQRATNAARAHQIGEKMRALEAAEREERRFDDIWERQRREQEGREEADALARRQLDAAQKAVLDVQVKELHDHRARERALAEVESAAMRERAMLDAAEATRVANVRRELVARANAELTDFNVLKKSQLYESVMREKQEDAARLAAQLAAEEAAAAGEDAAKESMQSETRLFAEHMMAQKRALASHESEQEQARASDNDAAWEKRLQVWGAEQEAREKLMAQVLEERRVQVVTKLEEEKIMKEKEAHARAKLEHELSRINNLEALKLEDARRTRLEHRALLEHQIKEKAFARAAAAFNTEQDRRASQRAEAAYQEKMARENARTAQQMAKYAPKK